MFASQKESKMTMLPLHQGAFFSIKFSFFIPCSAFLVRYSFGLTPGLEPCSPHSQCGTLPDKLKPTFVIEIGFEPISTVSETGMLPLHHSTISGSYESRTHSL